MALGQPPYQMPDAVEMQLDTPRGAQLRAENAQRVANILQTGSEVLLSPEMDGRDVNPKDAAALRDGKVPLDLIEHAAEVAVARAMHTGAVKYGRRNYRTIPIYATTYGAAIRRHVGAWLDGEDLDPESGLSHLAHIGANVNVLLGAMDAGTFHDDRAPATRSEIQELQSTRSNAQHSRAQHSRAGDPDD